jgi:hypothetical protein
MSRLVKAFLALVLALLVTVAVPAVATAADPPPTDDGCAAQAAGEYSPPEPCELNVGVLEPICDNDVPRLRYFIDVVGSPNTTVKITWINPDGPDYVQSGQPLSGTVLWPGAVEVNGEAVDWPGWTVLPDGTWVEGDEWDWVRPSVDVRFEVNPEATVTVAYPPSTPTCLTNPPASEVLADNPDVDNPDSSEPELSATGTDALPLALAGGALVAAGAVALAVTLRHRRTTQD